MQAALSGSRHQKINVTMYVHLDTYETKMMESAISLLLDIQFAMGDQDATQFGMYLNTFQRNAAI
jgi:hypothetical protein